MKNEMIENFENPAVDNRNTSGKEKMHSYRVGEEIHAKLVEAKMISGEPSMESLFARMLEIFGMSNLSKEVPSHAKELNSIGYYLQCIFKELFSCFIAEDNATELARAAVKEELEQNVKTIINLNRKIEEKEAQLLALTEIKDGLWAELENTKAACSELRQELQQTKAECENLQKSQAKISEAKLDAILNMLTAANKSEETVLAQTKAVTPKAKQQTARAIHRRDLNTHREDRNAQKMTPS